MNSNNRRRHQQLQGDRATFGTRSVLGCMVQVAHNCFLFYSFCIYVWPIWEKGNVDADPANVKLKGRRRLVPSFEFFFHFPDEHSLPITRAHVCLELSSTSSWPPAPKREWIFTCFPSSFFCASLSRYLFLLGFPSFHRYGGFSSHCFFFRLLAAQQFTLHFIRKMRQ